jgi:hypothetical protein
MIIVKHEQDEIFIKTKRILILSVYTSGPNWTLFSDQVVKTVQQVIQNKRQKAGLKSI